MSRFLAYSGWLACGAIFLYGGWFLRQQNAGYDRLSKKYQNALVQNARYEVYAAKHTQVSFSLKSLNSPTTLI